MPYISKATGILLNLLEKIGFYCSKTISHYRIIYSCTCINQFSITSNLPTNTLLLQHMYHNKLSPISLASGIHSYIRNVTEANNILLRQMPSCTWLFCPVWLCNAKHITKSWDDCLQVKLGWLCQVCLKWFNTVIRNC